MSVKCTECGFYYMDQNKAMCFRTNKEIAQPQPESCRTYITIKYDGDTPFTPAQHMLLYDDEQMQKGMTSMQGLRFR